METKRHFTKQNFQTRKKSHTKPKASLKILPIGYSLFAAKSVDGQALLDYTKSIEQKHNENCVLENSNWFGDYDVAKIYKTSSNKIYKWNIKVKTQLIKINKENENFFNYIFNNSTIVLTPTIQLTKDQVKKIENMEYRNPYLYMTNNEKAFYEFKFAFGFITLKEQYDFLKFVEFLIYHKFIKLDSREGKNVINKLRFKLLYYNTNVFFKRKEKYNRLSIYQFDKYSIMNLCRLVSKQYNITGVYQKNDTSFWFPDFIVYRMNIKEFILFNPHHNLTYEKVVDT
jgi:hypothetical protein